MTMYAKFQDMCSEMSAMYIEREEQILGIVRALLAREHVLLLGPPGTAKSAVICELTARVVDANMFERLLTPYSTPEEVFGPVSIQQLQHDKFERLTDGYLPQAHVGFIDEVFKANSAILNSLLTIMAERKFSNGRTTAKTPLMSLVGASNETPQEDNLAAMYDRFMVRFMTAYVSGSNVVQLLKPFPQAAKRTTISLADLATAQKEVDTVTVSEAIYEEVANLKGKLEAQGFKASDRRWRSSIPLLKACAYLDGRDTVQSDDLFAYSNVLWDDMKDAGRCASEVGKVVNPHLAQIIEHIDAVDKLLGEFTHAPSEEAGVNAMVKIKSHREALTRLNAGAKGDALKAKIAEKVNAAVKKSLKF